MAIIITGGSNDTINGTANADQISSDGGNDVINAGAGNDIVLAGGGNDTVDGGAGEDFIDGGDGNDRLFGGLGTDIIMTGRGLDLAYGGGGADLMDARLSGGGSTDSVTLIGDGFDSAAAHAANGPRTTQVGNDILFGGAGADTLYGDSADASTASVGGDDALTGGGGNDTLYGEGGNDILLGDAGNDILVGGRGADRLTGGAGNDSFVFDASAAGSDSTTSSLDIIYDFTRGGDRIDLRSILGATDLLWGDKTARAYGVWYGAQGNDTFIYADINGDSVADLTVRLNGKYTLAVSDFLGVASAPTPVADSAAVNEGGAAISGNVLTNDSPAALAVSGVKFGATSGTLGQNLTGTYGTLRLNADGSYTYTLLNNAAVNSLAAGQVANEVFTYVASAGGSAASSTLTIAITGINDAATVSGTNTGSVQEDGTLVATGALTVSDADAGQAAVQAGTVTKAYGTFVVAANGSWTYALNNAAGNVQSLRADQSVQDTLVVTSLDGTGSRTLTVNISGRNDAPVAVNDTQTMQEDGAPILINVLNNDTDVDNAPAAANAGLSIKVGSLSVVGGAAAGIAQIVGNQIRFTPAANFNGTATLSYVTTDGSLDSATATVTVTVNAVNDAAVITGTAVGAVTEDAPTASVAGDLQVTDVDGPAQAAFVVQPATAGAYGTFSVNAAGHWTYSLDNASAATQALDGGEHPTETFAVRSIDGTIKTVVITVNGSTDVAGRVTDGPIAGATVYLDNNGDGVVGAGDTAVAVTDAAGNFHFDTALNPGGFQLLAAGGTDTVTGEANELVMSAPAGYSYINPLTTLVQAIAEANGGNMAAAEAAVLAAFGLDPGLDLADTDIYADNFPAQQAAAIVATAATIVQEEGANTDPFTALAGHVATSGAGGGLAALEDVVEDEAPDALESFQETAEAIGDATSTADIRDALNDNYFNDAPVAANDTASTNEDASVTISVLANDTDADNLAPAAANAGLSIKVGSVFVVGGAATGIAQIVGNQIHFTPATNFNGIATINYATTDGTLDSAQATVTVNVAPVNDAPTQDGTGEAPDNMSGIVKFYNGVVITPAGSGTDQAFGMLVQPDGRVLTAGFTSVFGATVDQDIVLLRYNVDGSLDSSFGAGGKVVLAIAGGNDNGRAVALQGDGRIVVAGFVTNAATGSDLSLVRYNVDGTLDTSFGNGGVVTRSIGTGISNDAVNSIVIQPDGRILASGYAVIDGAANSDFLVVRYLGDGTPDTSFGTNGVVTTPIAANGGQDISQGLALQSNGSIVVAGWTFANGSGGNGANDFALTRYTSAGVLDTSFSGDGIATFSISTLAGSNLSEQGRTVKVLADGRILVGGWTTGASGSGQDFVLLRFNANGTLDTGFNTTGYVITQIGSGAGNDQAQSMLVQPDGRIVLVGLAQFVGATGQDIALVRYNVDGTLDTSFSGDGIVTLAIGAGNAAEQAFSATLLPDGRIMVAGIAGAGLGASTMLARFNADGSPDTSFSTSVVIQGGALFGFSIPAGWFGDPEGGPLTYSIVAANGGEVPAWLGFDPVTNRFSGTPPSLGAFDAELRLVATDSGGLTASQLLTIRVNDPPAIAPQPVLVTNEDTPASAAAVIVDLDGDPLSTVTVSTQPAHGTATIVPGTGQYTYTPFANYNGTDSFVIRSTDPTGASNTATVNVIVNPVNDAPYLANDDDTQEPAEGNIGILDGDGSSGIVVTRLGPGQDRGFDVVVQPDGKLLVVGDVTTSQGGLDVVLLRYYSTGQLDTSFGVGGTVVLPIGPGTSLDGGRGLALQSDGRIVVTGLATTAGGTVDVALMRFNSNGTADNSFGINGVVTQPIGTANEAGVGVTVLADGRILVNGYITDAATGQDFGLLRFTASGTLDATFGTGGYVRTPIDSGIGNESALATVIQPDGRIIVVGTTTTPGGSPDFALVRYAANGAVDTSFGTGGIARAGFTLLGGSEGGRSVALQPDGRILVAGWTIAPSSSTGVDLALLRFNSNGTLDTTFGGGDGLINTPVSGGNAGDFAFDMVVQPDGNIVLAGITNTGSATGQDIVLVRYRPDGSLDVGNFGGNGDSGITRVAVGQGATADTGFAVTLQPDGRILVVGYTGAAGSEDIVLLRFDSDGELDDRFNNTIVANQDADFAFSFPSGFIVDPEGGPLTYSLTMSDGSALPAWVSFNPATQRVSGHPPVGAADAVLRITGTDTGGLSASHLFTIRVNEGPIGAAATVGTNEDTTLSGNLPAATDAEGDAIVFSLAGAAAHGTAVVNPNGSYTYTPVANFNGTDSFTFGVNDIIDGEPGISNTYTVTVNVSPVNDAPYVAGQGAAAPANAGVLASISGVVTTAQGPGTSADQINGVVVQPDGKLLVAGYAQAGQGRGQDFAVARYNPDGSLDTSFGTGGKVILAIDAGSGADNARSIALQADGRIVVGGFTTSGATGSDLALVRLNSNGTVDSSFGDGDGIVTRSIGSGTGADAINGLVIQPDGRILASGYAVVDGSTTNDFLLVRYLGDGTPDSTFGSNGVITTSFDTTGGQDVSQSLTLLGDGRIVVVGWTYGNGVGGSGAADFALARYNSDGSLDTSFSGDGKATFSISAIIGNNTSEQGRSVKVLQDGRILVGGWTTGTSGSGQDFALLRFNADGGLDTSFNNGTGYVVAQVGPANGTDDVLSITVQSDGRILLAGFAGMGGASTGQDIALVRYNANGTLDTTFGGGDGVVTTAIGPGTTPEQGLAVALQADGRIVVGGFTGNISPDFALLRFTTDGVLDPTFNTNVTVQRGAAFGYTLPSGWFADPDAGDTLTYSVAMADGSALPSWLAFNTSTGRIAGTPGSTDPDAVLRITATDSGGLTAAEIVTIRINDAPVAAAAAFAINEDATLSNGLITLDPEGDVVLSFTTVTGPSHGTLVLNAGGGFTYTPVGNYSGSDTFVYRSTDIFGASSANATVTININPVNDAPDYILWSNAFNGSGDTLPGAGGIIATLSAFDPEGNTYSWSRVAGPVAVTAAGVLTTTAALTSGDSIGADVVVTDSLGAAHAVSIDFRVGSSSGEAVLGGGGEDVMFGLGGDDILQGNGGNDLIYTGSGEDNIVATNGGGRDTVMDFDVNLDEIDLRGMTSPDWNTWADVQSHLSQVNGGTLVDFGNGNGIFLVGVPLIAVTADAFLL